MPSSYRPRIERELEHEAAIRANPRLHLETMDAQFYRPDLRSELLSEEEMAEQFDCGFSIEPRMKCS